MTSFSLTNSNQIYINKKIFRIFVSVLLLCWILGFAILPFFHNYSVIIIFPFLKKFYSEFCHQVDYKTINLFGYKLFVCARCTGIYIGSFILSIYFIFVKKNFDLNKNLFYAAAFIMLGDVFCSTTGVYTYSKAISFTTGLFFGSVVFVYILALIDNYLFD